MTQLARGPGRDGGGAEPSVDAITFEMVRHKLHMVVAEAMDALKNVSGSPSTSEALDMMVSLYDVEGKLLLGGVGFTHHITSAVQAVKHLLNEYGDDPGIDEDDAYFLNDPYTAALHAPDVYIISPIHHDHERIGFVANFVHVTDIGGVDPGGFCPNATDSYQEGFQTRGLKLVERGRIRRDVLDTFLNIVRDPGMAQLDLKSQLAANHVAKERIGHLVDDFGVDAVLWVARELVDRSEERLRARLRSLPDGTWRARQYVDAADHLVTVELAATKEGDALSYDFTGSSKQLPIGINATYWASWGALLAPVFPQLAWDLTWNEGITKPIRMIAPEGTVVMSLGVFGGYPGSPIGYATFRGLTEPEMLERPPAHDPRADEHSSWGTYSMKAHDLQVIRYSGGGGYGDPLDRDPEAVLRDVKTGAVSVRAARRVYGVVLKEDSTSVDAGSTRERRQMVRAGRIDKTPDRVPEERAVIRSSGMPISEYLQATTSGSVQCTWCGSEVAPPGTPWKITAVSRSSRISQTHPDCFDDDTIALNEYFCGNCATLLDCEVARIGAPALHDEIRTWPQETKPHSQSVR